MDDLPLEYVSSVPLDEAPSRPAQRVRNDGPTRMLGASPAFLRVMDEVSELAPLDKPVLVVGERGTGKELIAERIHYLSSRWDSAFEKLNCAAISESLLESELFGHEAGAFTGATKRHSGRFERADGGTLFLDELATTSGLVQEKILRVIEYGEFERLGGSRTLSTDIRLVAATNEDLPMLAREGAFREDLLDRLAFDVVTLPPLRARTEDIVILAEAFAVRMATELGREFFAGFSAEAMDVLLEHHWPGNVRELKNVIERSVYRADPEEAVVDIVLDPFASPWRPGRAPTRKPVEKASAAQANEGAPAVEEMDVTEGTSGPAARGSDLPGDFRELVKAFEIELLERALGECQYNQKRTAEHLGMTYHQLRGILRKYPDLLAKD